MITLETFLTRLSSCISKHVHLPIQTPKDLSRTTLAEDKALLIFFSCGEIAGENV